MAIDDDLLNEVKAALGAYVTPRLTKSAASDLFEAYAFSLLIRAAVLEGAKISFHDPQDNPTKRFIFRTSPGYLWSNTKQYTFAVIEFPNVEPLEAHIGVRVSGKSRVLHELDVCVLYRSEAETSRRDQVHPRSSKMLIGIECKFYSAALNLGLGRAFIGLGTDVTADSTYFMTNSQSPPVEKLLSARGRNWGHRVFPGSTTDVDRARSEFQSVFKYFKAR